jgi:hypothetical protein
VTTKTAVAKKEAGLSLGGESRWPLDCKRRLIQGLKYLAVNNCHRRCQGGQSQPWY